MSPARVNHRWKRIETSNGRNTDRCEHCRRMRVRVKNRYRYAGSAGINWSYTRPECA